MRDDLKINRNHIPQLRVKSGLSGGQSIEACTKNVEYWQKEYQKWYQQALGKGYLPEVAVPYNS
jgi:hypothetical protein